MPRLGIAAFPRAMLSRTVAQIAPQVPSPSSSGHHHAQAGIEEAFDGPAPLISRPASRKATPALPPGLPIPPGFQASAAPALVPAENDTERQEAAQEKAVDTVPEATVPVATALLSNSNEKDISDSGPAQLALQVEPSLEDKTFSNKDDLKIDASETISTTPKKTKPSKSANKAKTETEAGTPRDPVKATVIDGPSATEGDNVAAKAIASPIATAKDLRDGKDERNSPKRPHPGKLVIPKSVIAESKSSAADFSPFIAKAAENLTRTSRAPSLSSASAAASANSRPATPAAAANTLNSPLPRAKQPRTLRITSVATPTVEKSEPAPLSVAEPTPAPNKIVASAATKIISRRPSLTSTAQPGTPISERIDAFSIASASVSRASSPPAIATNKRAERKKARKQAVQALESNVSSVEPTKAVEEVAPIVARQKKAKKPSAAPAVKPITTSSTETKPKAQDPDIEQTSAGAVREPEKIAISPAKPKKVEKPKKIAPPTPEPVSLPLPAADKNATAAVILAALESTEQLAIHTLNLLKPLASSKAAAWLHENNTSTISSADLHNHLQQLTFEITRMEDELLKQGQAIRKDSGDSRISGRNLVTSNGDRYACLSREEEDRVLELEKFISQATGLTAWGGASNKKQGDRGFHRQTVRVEGDILEAAKQGLALARGAANASGINTGRGDGKDSHSSYLDDSLRYVNAFVPPEVSDALLATTDSNGNAVAGLPSTTTTLDSHHYPNHTNEFDATTVSRSLAGLAAATQSATEALENQLGYQLGQIGLLDSVLGVGGIGGGIGGGRLNVKELERRVAEKRRETEGWEKKINSLIKKNRKGIFGGGGAN